MGLQSTRVVTTINMKTSHNRHYPSRITHILCPYHNRDPACSMVVSTAIKQAHTEQCDISTLQHCLQ